MYYQDKQFKLPILVALLICSTVCVSLFSCDKAKAKTDDVQQVESVELIRTSQSWDGVELPDYFEGRPELVAVKYVFSEVRMAPPCSHELWCSGSGRTDNHRPGWQDEGCS